MHALIRNVPSGHPNEYWSSTIPRLCPGHTSGSCRTAGAILVSVRTALLSRQSALPVRPALSTEMCQLISIDWSFIETRCSCCWKNTIQVIMIHRQDLINVYFKPQLQKNSYFILEQTPTENGLNNHHNSNAICELNKATFILTQPSSCE